MLTALGKIIEKRPWLVVSIVVLITIGFASFLPALQFKTDFKDFAPDNDLVKANNRVSGYFGMDKQILFAIVEKDQTSSTITPQALRDQYTLENELATIPEVNSTVSITTFVDTVCQMEYNKTINNCTDEQLQTAVNDLLNPSQHTNIQLFSTDDPDEQLDFHRSPRRTKGTAVNSMDIKNCYLSKDNTTITISFEVYSLSDIVSPITPPLSRIHTVEWYLGFENSLLPPEFTMNYQIAARIEPITPLWEIGNGVLGNLQQFIYQVRSHTLHSYKTTGYLWLQPPGQTTYFSIPLSSENITFEKENNIIRLDVSKKELGTYGIAPQYGSFEIPAKLTNFTAGVRYYQTPLLHRPGGRIVINTSFLLHRLEHLQKRPILGTLLLKTLENYGVNIEDFSASTTMLPETFSLVDLQTFWTQGDKVPDAGTSSIVYPIIPKLFDDLRINALSFISKDYEQTKTPSSSIIIIQLDSSSSDYDEIKRINTNIIETVETLDSQLSSITLDITGEGIVSTEINDVTMEANMIIGPSIFIIIVIILFLAFRKPSYVFLPILVFAFSCIWLFGTMALLGINFNIIAVALLPLNIGLGVEYSVNILYNYRTEIQRGRSPAEAVRLSIKEVGTAIFLAWFTTFVAFLSFLTASIPPVRDFGLFLALGITYTFIITMTFLTSCRYILDRKKKEGVQKKKYLSFSMKNMMGRFAKLLLRYDKVVFVITIVVCILMGTAVTQLQSGFSMNQFIPQDTPALTLFDKISEDFPFSSQDQEYILIEGNVATVQSLQGLSTTSTNMQDDHFVARKSDGSAKTESIYTLFQQAMRNNKTLLTTFHIDASTGIPRTDEDVYNLYQYLYESDEYGMQVQGVLYQHQGEFSATIIRVYIDLKTDSTDMTQEFEQLKTELNDDLADYGDATSTVTGTLLITLTIMKNMTESQIVSTAVCFLLAAIMLTLIYRNPILGLIAMIPVSISIIWVLGTMYFIGYTLNILTITVTCITVGVGIDYACYITERFRLVADKTGDVTTAVVETISRTGSAIFIAALSSMFGFGVLAFAPIPPQQQFGIITAITLIYAFITSILVLPLVLARWAKWRKKRKGYMIHPGAPKTLDGIAEDKEYPGEQ